MSQVTVTIDIEEHDMMRDEMMERLSSVDDDAQRAAQAHGMMTAATVALCEFVDAESIIGLLNLQAECVRDYERATKGVVQ